MANETMTYEGRTEPDFTAQTVLDATVLAGSHLSAPLDCVVGRSELAAPSPALECVLTFAARADFDLAAHIWHQENRFSRNGHYKPPLKHNLQHMDACGKTAKIRGFT